MLFSMCGIAGYIGNARLFEGDIQRTLELMKNRGPDSRDQVTLSSGSQHINLLHSRLSIIDLDPRSNQPFFESGCYLIFNGEIYNYIELREDLEKRGERFRTESDTEVLLKSYLVYGVDCMERFEGMWSFALWDSRSSSLVLSRDRFGEKPLYWHHDGHGIYFGSEVKFLSGLSAKKFSPNPNQLLRYLVNGYKSLYKTPDTFFNDLHEFEPGSFAVINSSLELKEKKYWSPRIETKQMTEADALEGTREKVLESVRIRLRSDVPLAFCLSGGIDSGTIASVAAKKFNSSTHCYSIIDPDERYNEQGNIEATAKDIGSTLHTIVLEKEASLDRLKDLIAYHDAPIATITYYIHSFLSKAISQDGFKVVFSGTAADELFTGYYDHFNLHLYEMRDHPNYQEYLVQWQKHILPVVRNPFLQNPNLYRESRNERRHIYLNNDIFQSYLKVPFNEDFTERQLCDSLLRNRMLNEIFYEASRVVLHEDDLNSMFYSLENRSPFLDSRLLEFAFSIPAEHLIKNGYGKWLLRESMKGILNDTVRLDRQKKGFNASVESVFDLDHNTLRDLLLNDSPIYEYVNRGSIEEVLARESYPNSFSKFLFNFINCKLFLEIHG